MERPRDHDIATALAEARPAPSLEFATELDEWAAAGFPRPARAGRSRLAGVAARVRGMAPRRLAFATSATALAAIVVATVVVASSDPGTSRDSIALERKATASPVGVGHPRAVGGTVPGPVESSAENASAANAGADGSGVQSSNVVPFSRDTNLRLTHREARLAHRDVERSAEIGLLADPSDVAEDSAAVFAAVHDARGIVLRSTTTSGRRGGARFDLLIPSGELGDALAAFSAIDAVRTRHEATADITAPTVATGERLRDSRARIAGLLAQLSSAETEAEMEALETELDRERRRAARLRSQLDRLDQRTDFSRVSVKIESGASSTETGGAWGIDDAFRDAGHILGIAAGVTLVGGAALAPLALLALLAWLAHRVWLRAARARALDA